MAVLAAILPLVSRSSSITFALYQLAAGTKAANHVLKTAKSINSLALIIKQVGTIIKEDDRIPSAEALETLEDVLDQCTALLSEIEGIFFHVTDTQERGNGHAKQKGRLPLDESTVARLQYLLTHLASLRATLAVMLQVMYTVQSSIWARVRPTVSPAQCANAVENEKQQLEALIIEQQMTILLTSKAHEISRQDTKLLMERDSSQSLVRLDSSSLQPSNLFKYQDKFLATLDTHDSSEEEWLPAVCSISRSQLERLLDRWSRLRQFEEKLQEEERKKRAHKREGQQPYVESDSEEDSSEHPTPTPQRPGGTQPLFADTQTLPIPIRKENRPATPTSLASSYGGSVSSGPNHLHIPVGQEIVPASPRSSTGTLLPVEAAAAIDAKDKDDDINLGIPWTLCTRRFYWKYIDSKIKDSNTDEKPSEAVIDRNSWTEILASWVCKEAIQEAGYKYTRMKKEVPDGARRTRFETCFCIEHPLKFKQVEQLVERTVDIYRKTQEPSPPPHPPRPSPRRSSFERRAQPIVPPPPPPPQVFYDRNRTPVPNMHSSLDKPRSSYAPPPPPPLDRSVSMPGPSPRYSADPWASNLHLASPNEAAPIPMPIPLQPLQTNTYSNMPHQQQQQQQQQPLYSSPQTFYPPPPPLPPQPIDPTQAHSPYRQSFPADITNNPPRHKPNRHSDYYYSSTSGTSDSDSTVARSRSRYDRSRSRSRDRRGDYSRRRKKKDGHSGATKAMMGVAGLTALLDGLVGI